MDERRGANWDGSVPIDQASTGPKKVAMNQPPQRNMSDETLVGFGEPLRPSTKAVVPTYSRSMMDEMPLVKQVRVQ